IFDECRNDRWILSPSVLDDVINGERARCRVEAAEVHVSGCSVDSFQFDCVPWYVEDFHNTYVEGRESTSHGAGVIGKGPVDTFEFDSFRDSSRNDFTEVGADGIGYGWPHLVVGVFRSEEHTSELQSRFDLVCHLLLE